MELFFKWIKQHLRIKSFWGTSENAVRIQIYSALIAYCLVAIVGSQLKINRSTYEILQIFGISLLDKAPVVELLTVIDNKDIKEQIHNQLSINLFLMDSHDFISESKLFCFETVTDDFFDLMKKIHVP